MRIKAHALQDHTAEAINRAVETIVNHGLSKDSYLKIGEWIPLYRAAEDYFRSRPDEFDLVNDEDITLR